MSRRKSTAHPCRHGQLPSLWQTEGDGHSLLRALQQEFRSLPVLGQGGRITTSGIQESTGRRREDDRVDDRIQNRTASVVDAKEEIERETPEARLKYQGLEKRYLDLQKGYQKSILMDRAL